MRLRVALLVGLLVVLATATPAEANHHPCFPRGATQILRTENARIYYRAVNHPDADYIFYGCLFSTRRPVEIGDAGISFSNASTNPSDYRVRGALLGSAVRSCARVGGDRFDCAGSLRIRNLRTGRLRLDMPYRGEVEDFEMTNGGSVAFIIQPPDPAAPAEVHAVEGRRVRLLDRSHGIQTDSLRLSGRTASWFRDGLPHAVVLR